MGDGMGVEGVLFYFGHRVSWHGDRFHINSCMHHRGELERDGKCVHATSL
jgi:hypothetical protein